MDISIPDLGAVEQVRLVRWLVGVGQAVQEGQEVAEVEADKAVFVIEAPSPGVLDQVLVSPGDSAEPGQVIGRLGIR